MPLTVAELIKLLQTMPSNAIVLDYEHHKVYTVEKDMKEINIEGIYEEVVIIS